MRFMVFDAPELSGDYPARVDAACSLIGDPPDISVVDTFVCADTLAAILQMRLVHAGGGEGIMVRHPSLVYKPGRTDLMLKLKSMDGVQDNGRALRIDGDLPL